MLAIGICMFPLTYPRLIFPPWHVFWNEPINITDRCSKHGLHTELPDDQQRRFIIISSNTFQGQKTLGVRCCVQLCFSVNNIIQVIVTLLLITRHYACCSFWKFGFYVKVNNLGPAWWLKLLKKCLHAVCINERILIYYISNWAAFTITCNCKVNEKCWQ